MIGKAISSAGIGDAKAILDLVRNADAYEKAINELSALSDSAGERLAAAEAKERELQSAAAVALAAQENSLEAERRVEVAKAALVQTVSEVHARENKVAMREAAAEAEQARLARVERDLGEVAATFARAQAAAEGALIEREAKLAALEADAKARAAAADEIAAACKLKLDALRQAVG